MLGRLNGLFGGVFSSESWALSQAYYYGAADGNPTHQVVLINGTPIDKLDELDKIWLGKPGTLDKRPNGNSDFWNGPADEAALLNAIISGKSYHQPCVRVVAFGRSKVFHFSTRKSGCSTSLTGSRRSAAMPDITPAATTCPAS